MNRVTTLAVIAVLASITASGQDRQPSTSPATGGSPAGRPVPEAVVKAVAVMRNVDQSRIPADQRHAKAIEMNSAWETLIAAGPVGAEALLAEVDALDRAKQKDHFFKLGAAAVLWQVGKTNYADRIAAIWATTPVKEQYQYTFGTAMAAAETQDPKVLPMLAALLRDDQGVFMNPMHAMEMGWPMNLKFIWGRFGEGGLPRLREVLNKSADPVELKSACHLLGLAGDDAALPRIRELLKSRDAGLRQEAIKTLGWLGHADDYDLLIGQLQSKDPKGLFAVVYALWEYGDCRAAEKVAPLLNSEDEQLREEIISCLERLPSAAGLDALTKYAAAKKDPELQRFVDGAMKAAGLTPAQWQAATPAERDTAVAKLLPDSWKPADDAAHKKLVEAIGRWQKAGRLDSDADDEIDVSAVRAEDAPLLLAAKASICRRVSDEGLADIRSVETLIQLAARIRYRVNPLACRQVQAATQPAASRPTRGAQAE